MHCHGRIAHGTSWLYHSVQSLRDITYTKPDMPDIHLMHEVNTTLLDMGKIIPAFDLKGCQLVNHWATISMWDQAMSADLIIDRFHCCKGLFWRGGVVAQHAEA